jgi:hypothetical protein
MTCVRAALLSLPLVIAGSAGAQSPAPATASPPAAAPRADAPAQASTSTAPVAPAGVAAAEQAPGRIGIGGAIGTSGLLPALYLPIDVGSVRVEGEVGYVKASTRDSSLSDTRIGIGIFGIGPTSPSVRAYGGVRVQYLRLESSRTSEGVRGAAVLGGEWAATPAVAFGVEGQLGYTGAESGSASGLDVSAQAVLRIFLISVGGPASAKPAASTGGGGAKSSGLQKCRTSDDCDRGICYEGYCRH